MAPEKIEIVYGRSQWIAQCFIYGDSYKTKLVAIIVPDADVVLAWAKTSAYKSTSLEDICQHHYEELKNLIVASMEQLANEAKLLGFERAKAVLIDTEPFTVENGILTPTFKLKRQQALEKYRSAIDKLYIELKE